MEEKYNCNICEFSTSIKKKYEIHLKTLIHRILIGEEEQSKLVELTCKNCNNIFNSRTSLWRHKKTCFRNEEIVKEIKCDNCNNIFYSQTTLWRHKKTCLKNKKDKLIKKLLQEKEVLKKIIKEQNNQSNLIEQKLPLINNTTITNVFNNNFNINVFLNEKCKNALNMSDFIQSISIDIEDLDKTKVLGFSKGLTNIIVKNLRQLDIYKRPIHCSDPMKEIMYIKNDNIWSEDKEDKPIVKNAISAVAKKQVEKVKEWEEHNNIWKNNEKGSIDYMHLVKEVTNNEESENNKIIKNLVREVTIKENS